jgi:hypothetical protein
MLNHGRHGTDLKREFSAEKHCMRAIDWLNDSQDDPGRRRIRHLLRNIRVLCSNWVVIRDEDDGSSALMYQGPHDEYAQAHNEVRRLLCRYKFSPLVAGLGGRVIPQWMPVSVPGGRFKGRWPPVAGKYDDVQAVFDLTWMSSGEGLRKIRECGCGRWFFVRFAHQKFCSARCRDKANKSAPQSKEYRRKKAREYYWLHKSKNTK